MITIEVWKARKAALKRHLVPVSVVLFGFCHMILFHYQYLSAQPTYFKWWGGNAVYPAPPGVNEDKYLAPLNIYWTLEISVKFPHLPHLINALLLPDLSATTIILLLRSVWLRTLPTLTTSDLSRFSFNKQMKVFLIVQTDAMICIYVIAGVNKKPFAW